MRSVHGLRQEGDGPQASLDFFRQEGVPVSILRDNSKMQASNLWNEHMRRCWAKDKFIEPCHPEQNPAERDIGDLKDKMKRVFMTSGCKPQAWFALAQHVTDISNMTAREC